MCENMVWRLLNFSSPNPAMNLAIEEAILRERIESRSPNTLRIWQHPEIVSVGCFQDPKEEVDLKFCRRKGIEVVRRVSSGGAIYLDEGALQYSIIVDEGFMSESEEINRTYELFSEAVIKGLSSIGIKTEFRPINDILLNGKKISGSSQHRLYKIILHHGTISVDVDIERMSRVLKISKEKFEDKNVNQISDSVTSIRRELKNKIDMEDVKTSIVNGFNKVLELDFINNGLTQKERNLADALYQKKYGKKEWVFQKTNSYDKTSVYKAEKGVIKVAVDFEDDIIHDIRINGDFFIHPRGAVKELENELRGEFYSRDNLEKIIEKFFSEKHIKFAGLKPKDFLKALLKIERSEI